MKLFLSDVKNDSRLFIGDLDSYTIIENGFVKEQLNFKIKLGLLLYDKILLPAAYFWQSKPMASLLPEIENLIISQNILPVIRNCDDTSDIMEYFLRREIETSSLKNTNIFNIPSLASEIATKENLCDVKHICNLNIALHLDKQSVKEKFIDLWLKDLAYTYDINSIKFILLQSNLTRNDLENIIRNLEQQVNIDNFSRASLVNTVFLLNVSQFVKNRLLNRISWLYLNANADVSNSDFYVTGNLYQGMVQKANLDFYLSTLNVFGIDNVLINNLSNIELLRIRESIEYKFFIQNYFKLIDNIVFEQNNILELIIAKENKRFKSEQIKSKLWRALSFVQRNSTTLLLGLIVNYFSGSVLNHTVSEVIFGASVISNFLFKFDKLNKFMQTTSFLDFRDYIIKEQYKNRIYKNLEGINI